MISTLSIKIPFAQIKDYTKPIRIFGKSPSYISSPAPINTAIEDQISFCTQQGDQALSAISNSKAGIIICYDTIQDLEKYEFSNCIFTVFKPRLSFSRCLNHFFSPSKPIGIHSTAIIDQGVHVPSNVYVGHMTHICSDVSIGEGTYIEDFVHIAPNTIIGKNVTIQTGTVVGCGGQGFERIETGEFEKFPQLGVVMIEDNVEIGANTTIVRGTLATTTIGRGSKIGHQVNIGHNVNIGKNVFISAGVIICGSVRIGDLSWLAPSSCIRNKVSIGKNVTVGLGAVVVKDVCNGLTVFGVPAK